jgi:CheY-like chemotaxis protein
MLGSRKLESLSVLAGGIAHDFNNLLTCIIGNASLARELAPPGEIPEMLDTVVKSGLKASHLTRQMLAYAGRGKVSSRPIDPAHLVEDLRAMIRAAIPEHISLQIETTGQPPAIRADASQIEQLLMNLVVNAAEAIEPGSPGVIRISIGREELRSDDIRNSLAMDLPPGPYLALRISDTGSGMDEETRSKIFDPFFTTKFTGRGLGLSAASGIVRGHQGAIHVATRPGAGSTFTIFLPASPDPPQAHPPVARALKGSGTILVVDDEGMVRQTAKTALEHYGYHVLLVENGQEAVDIFRQGLPRISLALLDLKMPVMSGDQAFPLLKSLQPHVPVIVSSACDEFEALRLFPEHPILFLQKPYTASQLAEKIQSVLEV